MGAKRRRRPPRRTILCLLVATLFETSLLQLNDHQSTVFFASAELSVDDSDEDDDFLAEILAEEARQEEEHAKLEAESKEYEAMRSRLPSSAPTKGGVPENRGKNKMGNGRPGKGQAGKERAGRTMPKGVSGATFSKLEAELKKKEVKRKSHKLEKEEAAHKAEKIRLQREADYEAKLKKMTDEQRRAAQQQKLIDARVVQRILKASKAGKHYAVLGIINLEQQVGPLHLFNISLGPFFLFRVPTKRIKRAYRHLARNVHPDKNKDGRAEEAFHALETSAAVLTDEKKRASYDKKIFSARRRRHRKILNSVENFTKKVLSHSISTFHITKRVLGPFSTPILVIGTLII